MCCIFKLPFIYRPEVRLLRLLDSHISNSLSLNTCIKRYCRTPAKSICGPLQRAQACLCRLCPALGGRRLLEMMMTTLATEEAAVEAYGY
jgi:hypothetical protein